MAARRVRPDSWITSSWTALATFAVLALAAVVITEPALRWLLLAGATIALGAPLALPASVAIQRRLAARDGLSTRVAAIPVASEPGAGGATVS